MVYWSNERPETVKLGCWGGYHKKITIRHFFWDTLYICIWNLSLNILTLPTHHVWVWHMANEQSLIWPCSQNIVLSHRKRFLEALFLIYLSQTVQLISISLNMKLQWLIRKAGHGPDGWMVGPEVDHTSLMVTTRNKVLKTPGIRFKNTRNKV